MNEETRKTITNQLIVCLEEKAARKLPFTLESPNEERLKELNGKGYGIFKTVNSFIATKEQLRELANKKNRQSVTKRNKEFLAKLNGVFADLDVCSDSDGMDVNERERRKVDLKKALDQYCQPTSYVVTKNGLQPIWLIDEEKIDEATQRVYVNVINGIIEWSKKNGAKGDPVKDVTRILRVPGYYHLKSDPYLVTEESGSGKVYTLDDLKKYFWHEPWQRDRGTLKATRVHDQRHLSSIDRVNALDIRQVAIDAWAEKGSSASFDKEGHLIVDGVITATFKGKLGAGNYIATSSSDYPAKGNAVTYVATTLGVTRKEAFKWLCKKYSIEDKKIDRSSFKSAFSKEAVHALAIHLINTHHIKTVKGKNREMYVYRDGIYSHGEDVVRRDIRELLQEFCTTNYSREILESIKDITAVDRSLFEVDVNLINCENGVYDLESNTLLPHDHQYAFLTKIPAIYDVSADCPGVKRYLDQVLDKEQVSIVQEWFGYALYRRYFIKKALICVGEGDTGKSTLINLFFSFVGPSNVSGVSLQKMSIDKFAVASLYNKYINLYDDLSFKDINDNGAFKIATGGSIITGEKKFGDSFQFKNFAKLTFACNKIPDLKDTNDDAYFKRWIVVLFGRIIEEENQDKHLSQKLNTPTELSGLLNFALEGLGRLLDRQKFSYDKEAAEIKKQMLSSASSVMRFVNDCLKEVPGKWISKECAYQTYQEYAHENHIPAVSMKAFCSKLPSCASYLIDYKPKDHSADKQVSAWRNVEFKVTKPDPVIEPEKEKQENDDPFSILDSNLFSES